MCTSWTCLTLSLIPSHIITGLRKFVLRAVSQYGSGVHCENSDGAQTIEFAEPPRARTCYRKSTRWHRSLRCRSQNLWQSFVRNLEYNLDMGCDEKNYWISFAAGGQFLIWISIFPFRVETVMTQFNERNIKTVRLVSRTRTFFTGTKPDRIFYRAGLPAALIATICGILTLHRVSVGIFISSHPTPWCCSASSPLCISALGWLSWYKLSYHLEAKLEHFLRRRIRPLVGLVLSLTCSICTYVGSHRNDIILLTFWIFQFQIVNFEKNAIRCLR